jgi:chemotaxis protein CheD
METLVGIAELKVSKNPGKLVTIGLGSCIAVVLYDPIAKVGALIHAMLPRASRDRAKFNKAKFVDTAIPLALEEMEKLGARRERITAKLIGGAKMFPIDDKTFIGDKNAEMAENILRALGIRIMARDIGGAIGRTVEFDVSTGRVLVKTASHGAREL